MSLSIWNNVKDAGINYFFTSQFLTEKYITEADVS